MIHVFTFNNYHFHTMKNVLSKILSLFILFFVCAQSAQAQGGGNELIAPTEITASSTATLTTFDITSNTTWRLMLSPTVDWVTNFEIIEGDGDTIVVITHEANTGTESREATFTLRARDVRVDPPADIDITFTQQAPIDPLFSILYTQSISASSDATESVYNTGDVLGNWRFSLSSEASWITNISVAGSPEHPYAINGRYGTDIRITHTANTTSEVREAMFTYEAEDFFGTSYYTITLRQEAGATAPVTTVDTITTQTQVNALSIERFTFDGDLIIKSAQVDSITDLSPLSNITEVTGDIIIDGGEAADGLTSLNGLRQLQTIGGSFTISNHSALTALDIFPSLQSIGGSFRVFGNSVLTNLGGFANLTSIGSTEEVLIVDTLTDITNIGSAEEELPSNSISFKENISLFIMSNPLLEDCCVLTSFFSGATHAVSGEIRIGNNAIGCSGEGRIEGLCSTLTLTSTDSILSEENFSESKFHYLPQVPEEFRVVNTVYTADVSPTDQTFTVGIDIDNSATGWRVSTTENFITFSDIRGMGDGTLDIRIAENTDTAARTAVITFTPTGGENLNARYLVITQEAAFPTLTISSSYPISPKIGSEARYTMNIPPEPITFTINVALGGGAIGWGARRSVDEILGDRIEMSSISSNDGPFTVVTGEGDTVTVLGRGDGTVDITTGVNISLNAPERIEIIVFYPITTTGETRGLPVFLEITQLNGTSKIPTIDLSGTGITAPSESEMNYTTNVNDTAQTLSVNIDIGGSTTGWTVSKTSDPESFVTLPTTTSGVEDDTVDIIIAANTSTERSATIIFTSTGDVGNPVIRTLVITQKAGPATFMLSSIREYVLTQGVLSPVSNIDTEDNINYTASVGPMLQTLDVTVDIGGNVTGWEVSKSEDADFISLVMRDDRVGITIAPNATIEKRSATLTFTSTGDTKTTFTRYLEITQTEGYPTLTLSSTPTPFSVAPDDVVDYTLNVDSSSQEILVNIDLGGSAGGWSVYKKGDFISFSNSDTTGTEDETVTFLIESNRSTEVRSALITFLATGPTAAENDTVIVEGETVIFARTITLARTVRITQLAGDVQPPTLTLSGEGIILPTEDNPNHTVNVSVEEDTLTVDVVLGGSATGWMVSKTLDIENFITLPATTMGMENDTVAVGIAIAENPTTEKRSATITFTSTSTEEDSGNPIIQTLVITQEGITPTLTLTSPNNVRIPNTATIPTDSIEIIFTVGGRATGWTTTFLSERGRGRFLKLNKSSGSADTTTIKIKAYATANTGAERTARIILTTIGGTGPADSKTITIKQAAGPHKLTLSTFSNVDFRSGEESDTVIADATTTTFSVNINIGGGAMGWEAAETSDLADFITLPENSVGNDDGRWVIMMDPNTDNTNRTATITFTTTGDEGDPITRTLVITQKRPLIKIKRPLLLVSSDTLTVGFRDTTITVSIDIDERSVTGWEAKEMSGLTNFVTLPENSVGNSDGTLDIMVKANNLDIEREARVILIPKIVGGGIDTVTFIDNVIFADMEGIFGPRRIELVLYLPTRKMGMDTTIELNTQSVNYDILYDSIEAFLRRRSYTRVENIITPTLVIRQEANPNHTLDISSSDVDLRKSEESDTVLVDAVATATTFTVNIDIDGSATGWEAKNSDSVDFITLSGDSVAVGNGDGSVEIMIEASNINIDRTATIIFTTTGDEGNPMERTLVIRQDANPPTVEISSTDGNIRKGEESYTTNVNDTAQMITVNIVLGGSAVNWEATETSDFISLDSDTVSGRGDGTLDITIEANTLSTERNDTITFTTTAHSGIIDNEYRFSDTVILIITQLAADFPTLTILGDTLSAGGIDRPVVFEGGAQTFTVAIDIGSSFGNWEISEVDEDDFVTLPNSTTGTRNGEVEFTLSNNESTAFRTATITFTFTGGSSGSSFTQTLNIFQYQKLLTLSGVGIEPLSGDEKYHKRTYPYIERSFNVSITLDDIISDWKIASNDKDRFVIFPESTTGTGNDEVTFRILNNSSLTENRADTITFEGTGEGIEIVTRRFLVIEQGTSPSPPPVPMIGIRGSSNRDATFDGGKVDIEITSSATTTWRVNTTASWVTSLTFTPTRGSAGTSAKSVKGKGSGTLRIIYSENITDPSQIQKATLRLVALEDTTELADPEPIDITITQEALPNDVYKGNVTLKTQAAVDTIRKLLGEENTVIHGYLQIGDTTIDKITDLSPLNFLTKITGNFFIGGVSGAGNDSLTNIGDFPVLQKIGGGYSVADNPELVHGGNFPVLESIGDKFIASGGTSESQNDINVLHGYLFIRSNLKLESLGTFPRLKRIATSFTARGHDSLRSLYEFPSLISIGTGNPFVPSKGGFPGNTSIVIEDSPMLASCCVLRNFFPGEPNAVSGDIYIGNGNAVGCNSTTEITDAMCPPSIILESTNTVVDIEGTATAPSDSIVITFVVGGGATGWKATLEEDTFITLGDTTGSVGRVTLKVAVTANAETESRSATITLTAMGGTETANTTVTITQSVILSLTITSGNTVDVPNTATEDPSDSIEVTFTVGGGATGWKATTLEENPFITLSDSAGSEDSGTIKVAVTANMGVSRMNTIEITTVGDGDPLKTTVVIMQRGASPTLMLISADSETIAHDAGSASDIMFTIGGGAERWTAAVIDEKNFLTLDPPAGDADATTFRVVTIENNRGEERTNTIVIATVGGTGDPVTDTITITQEEVPTILLRDPSDGMISIDYNETALQTIIFDVGGSAKGWTASSDQGFVRLDTMGSSGTGIEVTTTPMANTGVKRTATITISTTGHLGGVVTEEVTIIQQGPPPTLSLTSDREKTIAYDGTTVFEINFTVGGGATGWKADVRNGNREEFITLDSLDRFGGGRGSNTLRVTSDENTGEKRMNSIVITTVGGIGVRKKTIIVTQEAVPTIVLSASNKMSIAYDEVTPQTITFDVGGSAAGWEVSSNDDFIMSLSPTSGISGEGIEVMATFTENNGEERTATITISTTGQLGEPVTKEVTIRQREEAPPTLMLTSNKSNTIAYNAISAPDITFTVGGGAARWEAKVINEDKFLTLVDSAGNAGRNTIRVTFTGNTGEEARIDTIVIATVGGTGDPVTDTITITQEEVPTILLRDPSNGMISIDYNETALQTITFDVGGSAKGWTASSDQGFVRLDTMGSSGTGIEVKATPMANIGAARTATITISTTGHSGDPITVEVTITQGAAPPTLEVSIPTPKSGSDTTIAYDATTLNITFTVGGVAGWNAEVIDEDKFLTLVDSAGNAGTNIIRVTVDKNIDKARIDTIVITTVGGTEVFTDTITVTQAAGPPTLVISDNSVDIGSTATSDSIEIIFTVGGGAAGWKAKVDEDFVTLGDTMGSSGTVTLKAAVTENMGGERTATITISTTGHLGDPITVEVTIVQRRITFTHTGNITVTTQAGVDTLTLTNIDTINGDVIIGHAGGNEISTITDLTPLSNITHVTGDLLIARNGSIVNLNALTRLQSIGGYFNVRNNDVLTTLGNFSNLQSIGGYIRVSSNGQLTTLGDFTNLTSIGMGTPWVPSEGDTISGTSIVVENNSSLSTCCVLTDFLSDGVNAVSGNIYINNNAVGCDSESQINTPLTLISSNDTTIAYDNTALISIDFTLGCGVTDWTSKITYTPANANFITLSSTGSTTQTGAITIMAAPTANTGGERTATITLMTSDGTEADITITQAAGTSPVSDAPTLMLTSGNTVDVPNTATTSSDSIAIMFVVGGGATGWTAAVDENFVTLGKTMGSSGIDTLTLKAAVTANAGVARTATVTITTTGQLGDSVTAEVTITQATGIVPPVSNPPTLMLTSGNTVDVPNTATSSDSVEITFVVGGGSTGWTAEVDEDFVTLGKTMGSSGTATLKAAVTENTGVERTAIITLTATTEGTEKADTTIMIKQGGAPPTLEVSIPTPKSGSDTTIAYDATTLNVMFTVGGGATGWEATVIDRDDEANDFLTLVPASGTAGTNTIRVTVDENTGGKRMDTVVITTVGGTGDVVDTVIVTQEAVPTIEITVPIDKMITIDHNVTDAQTITFNVGGSATGWTVSSDHDSVALSLTSGSSGEGIEVTATFKENKDVERSATITLMTTGQLGAAKMTTVTFTQKGSPDAPKLDVTTPSGLTDTVANTATTSSDSIEIMFTVEKAMGWESMISYGVGEDEFITLSETTNVDQIGDVTIKAAVTKNEGVERSATITLSTTGQSGFSAATREITIVQSGAPPTITESGDTTIAYNVTATDILDVITFEVGGGATGWKAKVIDGDKFLTLVDSKGDADTGTIRVTATGNTGEARMDTIVITTEGGTGDADADTVIVTQEAVPTIEITDPIDKMITIDYNAVTDTTITFNVGGSATGWTAASSDQGFVRLDTMGSSGIGIEVTATPMANTGAERTATITITTTGQLGASVTAEVTITQSKAPTILVDPHTIVLTSGNTVAVAKTATTSADSIEIRFVVGGESTGWKAAVDEDFVTLDTTMGPSGMDTLTLKAAVTENTGAERTATVTITTTGQLGDSVTAEVTITQATGIVPPVSNPPTLMLTSKNAVAVTNAATDPADSIAIMFTVGGGATGWTAAVNPTFVTLGKSTGSSGTVTLKAAVTANAGVPARTATITLTTIGGTGTAVDATITITQAGTPLSVPTQTPLAIYPNPVGNTLTIEGASTSLQISIMDFSGRQVAYSELSTGQNTLDVADLPSGLYVIIVHGEEGEVFTGQIFKK